MEWKKLIPDIVKYIICGILGVVASQMYNAWQIKPENNINLMLLQIERHESCDVVQEKLRSVRGHLDSVPESLHDYIKVLASQPPPVVQRANVPPSLIEELQKAEILRCKYFDPRYPDRVDPRYNHIIRLSAVVSISKPSLYILKPSCWIVYQGSRIPVRFWRKYQATDFSSTSGNRENEIDEPLTIKETGSLLLVYDPWKVDESEMTKEKFARFVKSIEADEVEVTAECSVVFSNFTTIHFFSAKW
jgi:hypothetical protein